MGNKQTMDWPVKKNNSRDCVSVCKQWKKIQNVGWIDESIQATMVK